MTSGQRWPGGPEPGDDAEPPASSAHSHPRDFGGHGGGAGPYGGGAGPYSAGPGPGGPGSGATIPAPPPGPGVRPPFAAAPVEGRTARLWLGLGLAGAVLALCCGAGVVALGGLIFTGVEAVNEQARAATADYLDAEIAGDWQEAYEQRCARDRRAESLPAFTDRVSSLPRIESYRLDDAAITPEGMIRMPATVRYADGSSERLSVPLVQNSETGRLEVCGLHR